jgi:preprotein translocase subunit SecG
MDLLWNIIMFVHVLAAIGTIGLVLVQHGKGADMGAAFGSGSSGSLFGATGSANFLSRTTAILATIFFVTSLAMAYLATNKPRTGGGGVMDGVTSKPVTPPAAPTVPSPAAIPGQDPAKAAAQPAAPAAPAATTTEPAKDGSKANQIPK